MKKISILTFSFILIALLGCKKDKDVTDPNGIEDVITAAGIIPTVAEKDEVTRREYCPDATTVNEESHSIAKNFNEITYLGLNDDVLWPGNIIKGDRIANFIYEPVSLDRAPLTLSVNLEGSTGGGILSTTINNPSLSTVRQGIHDIIKNSVGVGVSIPAKIEIEKTQVYSASQMDLAIGADISYGGGSLSTKFNFETNTQKTRIVARYKQIYYTINVDQPSSPADFFDPSITIDEAKAKMPPGSQPVYVSGVSYGAMALMFIESDLSKKDLDLAIDASYSGFGLDVTLTNGMTAAQVFAQTSTTVVVYGGSTDGIKTFTNINLESFFNYIQASSQFNPTSNTGGVPLSYSFRHLSNNTLAQVSLTSDYTIITPCPPSLKYEVSLDKLVLTYINDADDNGEFFDIRVTARAYQYSNETNGYQNIESLSDYLFDSIPSDNNNWPWESDDDARYICFYKGLNQHGGPYYQIKKSDTIWATGTPDPAGDSKIPEGDLWIPEYMFQTDTVYDMDKAGIEFTARIFEYDGNKPDVGKEHLTVSQPTFIDNAGDGSHMFLVNGLNESGTLTFTIEVHVKIEAIVE